MFNITYQDYHDLYHGELDESVFDKLMMRSVMMVDDNCYNRLLGLSKEDFSEPDYMRVLFTVCETLDILYKKITEDDPTGNSAVSSETVGSWRTVYSADSVQFKSMTKVVTDIVLKYLDGTFLRCAWV